MRKVKVAATQMSCSNNIDENIRKAENLVRDAAKKVLKSFYFKNYLKHHIFVKRKNPITIYMLQN